jgi:hypothetical protein
MSSVYFNVSGIEQNEDTETVFIRYRNGDPDDDIFLGAGRVVGVGGCSLLPGIQAGQFSITFRLPDGGSVDNIVVSRDKNGTELLSDVTITRCLIRAEARSGGTIIPGNSPVRAGATNVASHLINRG